MMLPQSQDDQKCPACGHPIPFAEHEDSVPDAFKGKMEEVAQGTVCNECGEPLVKVGQGWQSLTPSNSTHFPDEAIDAMKSASAFIKSKLKLESLSKEDAPPPKSFIIFTENPAAMSGLLCVLNEREEYVAFIAGKWFSRKALEGLEDLIKSGAEQKQNSKLN